MIKKLLLILSCLYSLNVFALDINVSIQNNSTCDVVLDEGGSDNMVCSDVPRFVPNHTPKHFKCHTTSESAIKGFNLPSHGGGHIEFWYNHSHQSTANSNNVRLFTVDYISKKSVGAASTLPTEQVEIILNEESIIKSNPATMDITFIIK